MRYWCGVQPKLCLKTRLIRYELHLAISARSAILMPVCRLAAMCPWMQRTCHGTMVVYFDVIIAWPPVVASADRSAADPSAVPRTSGGSDEICITVIVDVIIAEGIVVICRLIVIRP